MPDATPTAKGPQRVPFDPEMSDAAVDRILGIAPFSKMNPDNFRRVSLRDIIKLDTRIKRFRKGEIVVRQGDYGTSAFLIISGNVRVVLSPGLPPSLLGRRQTAKKNIFSVIAQLWTNPKEPESFKASELRQDAGVAARRDSSDEVKVFLQDIPRLLDRHKTVIIETGEVFGEIAALSRMPRSATIFCETDDAELLEIRWQGLRDFMKGDDHLRNHIDEIYRQRALATALREVPVFKNLSDEALKQVIEQTHFATHGEYDWSGEYKKVLKDSASGQRKQEPSIADEGDYPNGVVLIKSGFARVSQKFGNGHRTLNYLGAGQIYGLQEIAHNWRNPKAHVPLQYTLRVIGYTHVIIIPTHVMEEVVLPNAPEMLLPPPVDLSEKEDAKPAHFDASAKIGADTLEFLTENRFFNGTATMVIDLDRCTRCDDCVRACAASHDNNPRFLRHGPINGKLMIANACMHCVDPICMIGCPTGAIHRSSFGGQVVINPVTCIGCQICFNNCPYDAIRMVEIRDENGVLMMDSKMKPVMKATKCDLCIEQIGGPSCQRACPHGALARVNMNDLDSFANWLRR